MYVLVCVRVHVLLFCHTVYEGGGEQLRLIKRYGRGLKMSVGAVQVNNLDEGENYYHLKKLKKLVIVSIARPAIERIKKHLGHDWKRLGRALGFNKTDLDSIETANPHVLEDQINDLFVRWKRRAGHDATLQQLVAAARAAELDDLFKQEAGPSGKSTHTTTLDNPI